MQISSNLLTHKRIGAFMLGSTLLMIFAMLHHPQGTSQNIGQNSVMKWVHGVLIFLLVFNAYGLSRLVNHLNDKDRDTNLAMIFYYIGLGSIIMAALVSGFIQTSLPDYFSNEAGTFSDFNRYSAILNQAFAKLGIISFGAAGVFLTPSLIGDKGVSRLLGIVGCTVGIVLIFAMISGIYLSVLSMTLLTVLIVIWHIFIAVWLLKY